MTNKITYKELIDFCVGAQNNKDVFGWETLKEFEHTSLNKNFDAKVYKRNNRIVIAIAGTDIFSLNDLRNDVAIKNGKIPSQYWDAERLYNLVKSKYPNAVIESVGYFLGATLSNLLSHRTGIASTVITPIGSQHIVDKHKDYFKYDGSNITTYGRIGDFLFNSNIKKQSGNINIMPDLPNKNPLNWGINHLLHTMTPIDIFNSSPTGFAAPLDNHIFSPEEIGNSELNKSYAGYRNPVSGDSQIFTREDIGRMSTDKFTQNESAIFGQLNFIGVPAGNELNHAFGTIYVEPYVRSDGTPVRGYYRSV